MVAKKARKMASSLEEKKAVKSEVKVKAEPQESKKLGKVKAKKELGTWTERTHYVHQVASIKLATGLDNFDVWFGALGQGIVGVKRSGKGPRAGKPHTTPVKRELEPEAPAAASAAAGGGTGATVGGASSSAGDPHTTPVKRELEDEDDFAAGTEKRGGSTGAAAAAAPAAGSSESAPLAPAAAKEEDDAEQGKDSIPIDLPEEGKFMILFVNLEVRQQRNENMMGGYGASFDRERKELRWQSQWSDVRSAKAKRIVNFVARGGRLEVLVRRTTLRSFTKLGEVSSMSLASEAKMLIRDGAEVVEEAGGLVHRAIGPNCLNGPLKSGVGLRCVTFRAAERKRSGLCKTCCFAPAEAIIRFSSLTEDGTKVAGPPGPRLGRRGRGVKRKLEMKEESAVKTEDSAKTPGRRFSFKQPPVKLEPPVKRELPDPDSSRSGASPGKASSSLAAAAFARLFANGKLEPAGDGGSSGLPSRAPAPDAATANEALAPAPMFEPPPPSPPRGPALLPFVKLELQDEEMATTTPAALPLSPVKPAGRIEVDAAEWIEAAG